MEGRNLKRVAEEIKNAKNIVALTGAGISTESGIPDFRSKDGIWSRFNIDEYGYIGSIIKNPEKVWKMLRILINGMRNAKPNPAHFALAEMERMGYLDAIITQNVDGLHQAAGSKNVIEFHGNFREAICPGCGRKYEMEKIIEKPICKCGGWLKPNAVFFGEEIPREVLIKSFAHAQNCDVMLVIGTSAMVYPAAHLPYMAKDRGAIIVEINKEKSGIWNIADYSFYGMVGKILPKIVEYLQE